MSALRTDLGRPPAPTLRRGKQAQRYSRSALQRGEGGLYMVTFGLQLGEALLVFR